MFISDALLCRIPQFLFDVANNPSLCRHEEQWHPRKGRRMPSPRPIANSYTVHALGAPRRRPRTRSQVHCVYQDPGQRVFRVRRRRFAEVRSADSTNERLHQWGHWQRSLQHPLGEHLNSFSLLTRSRQRSELLKA